MASQDSEADHSVMVDVQPAPVPGSPSSVDAPAPAPTAPDAPAKEKEKSAGEKYAEERQRVIDVSPAEGSIVARAFRLARLEFILLLVRFQQNAENLRLTISDAFSIRARELCRLFSLGTPLLLCSNA